MLGMKNGLNSVPMVVGVMEKGLYLSYTPPIRPRGTIFTILSPAVFSVCAIILLSNGPGAIALTLTCRLARCAARVRVR